MTSPVVTTLARPRCLAAGSRLAAGLPKAARRITMAAGRGMRPFTKLLPVLLACASLAAAVDSEVWTFDRLDRVGGHPTTVVGEPRVVDTPVGKAIEFDGVDDRSLSASTRWPARRHSPGKRYFALTAAS